MRLSIANAREEDLQRAEELTVRTNQLNTTGKPYSYSELKALMDSPAHHILTCELSDKFGTHGKIGLALIEEKPDFWHLNLFLMSCRVMPYGVGSVFLTYIMSQAKKSGKKLLVDFFKTDRNRMMYITFKFANFKETIKGESGNIILEHDLSVIHNLPQYVEIIV
jgi:FkbH-like protein